MPNHRLRRGMHYRAGGRDYVVEKRLPGGDIQVKEIVTNVYSAVPEMDVIGALFSDGNAELLGDNRNQEFLGERLKKTRVSDLTLLAEDDPRRADAERRRAYVLEVMKQKPHKLTEETLRPIIDEVGRARDELDRAEHKRLPPSKKAKANVKPSVSTVIRWFKLYIKAGEDERAFVPATKARGNRKRKFSGPRGGDVIAEDLSEDERATKKEQAEKRAERVGELVEEAVDEVFLNRQRFSVQDVCDVLTVKIADENKGRPADDQLPIPHQSSVYDIVNKMDDYEILEARFGEKIAEQRYRAFERGPRPTRPLERVEADHTKTDLFVVDPVMMLPIGRAVLTWMICVYTKMILGYYISFNPYSSLSILECLKHAIRPKTYVRSKYPSVNNTWPTYGVMETLVLDNAAEFWGKHLEDACHQLGVNIQYGQKGRAWYRASIERSFRTLNSELLHRQPGTTFSNVIDRADYDPGKTAIITPDALDEVFHKYIVDVQQLSPHRGIRDIPRLRWDKGIQMWPPALPAKARDLDIVLGAIERRQIHSYGIEIDTIIYNDEVLAMLRREAKEGEKFVVKRNLSDLSWIHVYDERHDRYLPILAVDQEYTKGLTLYQHNVIRRYVRERLRANVDIVSLCRAKMEIQEIVEREWTRSRRTKVRMARYRNEGVQDRSKGSELISDDTWVDELLGLPEAKEKLMLMSPGAAASSRRGVSDFGSPVEVGSEAEGGFIEAGAAAKRGRAKTGPSKKSSAGRTDERAASSSGFAGDQERNLTDVVDGTASLEDEGELDMTGWDGGLDLPT